MYLLASQLCDDQCCVESAEGTPSEVYNTFFPLKFMCYVLQRQAHTQQIAIAKQILELNSEIKCFLSYRIYIQLFLSSCQFFVLLIFIRWLAGCHQTDFQKKIYDIARSCLANILVFYCYFIFMVYIIAIHATAQLFQTEWNSTLKIKYRFFKKVWLASQVPL